MINGFTKQVQDILKYYVYVYSDPDTHKPFYVGKGKGNRVFAHLKDQKESEKVRKITEIYANGKEPIIEILAHGLDEETALKVEAAAIDLIGISNLTNQQRGHSSSFYGKIDVSTLNARYYHEDLMREDITDNVMMIRINKLYRNGMTPFQLYEATRGYWGVNPENANKVDYVLAVYEGMVLEVYEVKAWFPAFSTWLEREDPGDPERIKKRYEFVGKIADETIRVKYVDKDVSEFFKPGNQSSFMYFLND